jgi:hypothetical protein
MLCTGAGEAIVSVLVFPETPDAWEKMGWEIIRGEKISQQYEGKYILFKNAITSENCVYAWPARWATTLSEMGYFHQYPCKANPAAQQALVKRYREFWEAHVLTGIPPEPENYDDITRLFPAPKGTLVVPPGIAARFQEYKQIRDEIGAGGFLAKRQDTLKTEIINWARKEKAVDDEESETTLIMRDDAGKKLGQYGRQKNGTVVFRAS